MVSIVENTTASPIDIKDIGITVPANGTYDLASKDRNIVANSNELITLLGDGTFKLQNDPNATPITYWTAAEAQKIYAGIPDLVLTGGQGYEFLCTNTSGVVVWNPGTVAIQEEGVQVGSIPFSTLNFIGSDITATDAGSGQANITVTAAPSIFGSEFEEAADETMSTTTSTTYVTKLTHTTPSLPSGSYRVGYSFEAGMADNGKRGSFFVEVDGAAIAIPNVQRNPVAPAAIWTQCGGFDYQTLSGAITINIKYKTNDATVAAKIRRARLEIWRIS